MAEPVTPARAEREGAGSPRRKLTKERSAGANRRRVGAIVAVVIAVGVAAYVAWSLRGPGPRVLDVPETAPSEPPPNVPAPRTEEERIRRLLDVLLNADTEEAMSARAALEAAGDPARAIVMEMARGALQTNRAFAEHAFDLFLRDPRPTDVPLALEALASTDVQLVERALILLGRVADAQVRAELPRIARAIHAGWPAPRTTLRALIRIGGDDALTELERIATSPEVDPAMQGEALEAIGEFEGERARAILERELKSATERARVIAVAGGLARRGDAEAVRRLREFLPTDLQDRVLVLLAIAKDDVAFAEIEKRLRAELESDDRRLTAIALLQYWPFQRRAALLRWVVEADLPRGVRAEAWKQIAKDGEDSDRADLLSRLRSRDREERLVAALAVPASTDAGLGRALLEAEAANRDQPDVRVLLLRAMIFSGRTECAETVVRAMASDPSPHGSGTVNALAYELWLTFANASDEFRKAACPWVRKALSGGLGDVGEAARVHLVMTAGLCCGAEAADELERLLVHEDRHVREQAADVLGEHPGPATVAALRNAWWRRQDEFSRRSIARALHRAVLRLPVR